MSSDSSPDSTPPVLWNPDTLDARLLAITWDRLTAFVVQLRGFDISVPGCWYVHGWVVQRLLALQHWRDDAYGEASTAKTAAEWWTQGLVPLTRDWAELTSHHDAHPPADRPWDRGIPTPQLDDVIAAAIHTCEEQTP